MPLPASLTCRRPAPWGLGLRPALVGTLFAAALALPPVQNTAQAAPSSQNALDLTQTAQRYESAKAFAKAIAQGSGETKVSWPQAKAYLLAPRSHSPVDYRNVLAEIGISPNHPASDSHAWLEELVELPRTRVSDLLAPVFSDLLVTAGLLSWLGNEMRHDPELRRDGLSTLLDMGAHHKGTFVTGVDDAIARNSLWTIPTLLLVQAGLYDRPVSSRTQARLPDWIALVKADALRKHAPTRIRNPQVMQDFLLALAAIQDPMLAEQLLAALGAPNPKVRQVARLIARSIAPLNEVMASQNRKSLEARWTSLGADPAKIPRPGLTQRLALARALNVRDLQSLPAKLQEHLNLLDEQRKGAWRQAISKALSNEHFDQLSALFAQEPGELIDEQLVQNAVDAMDLSAGELLGRDEQARAAELWARAHSVAKAYNLKDHELLAAKRDQALLSIKSLSSHARRTLHRSLRPEASELETQDRAQTPGWKGSAIALFSVLLIPGAWTWMRRRL